MIMRAFPNVLLNAFERRVLFVFFMFGLFLAYSFDLPASGTIVILSFLFFGLFFLVKRVGKAR